MGSMAIPLQFPVSSLDPELNSADFKPSVYKVGKSRKPMI